MADTFGSRDGPYTFFAALVRAETRLYNAVSDRVQAAHGIGVGPVSFLRFIAENPGCRVADVGQAFAVGIGATSKFVDRQVAQGHLRREPNPKDRRSSLLALTESGLALITAAETTIHAALAELLDPVLSPGELAAVAEPLERLRGALEAAGEGTPVG